MASLDRISTNTDIVDLQINASNDVEHTIVITTTASALEFHSVLRASCHGEGSAICVVNDSGETITLKHNSNSASAGAAFLMASGADVPLAPRAMLWGKFIEGSSTHANGWWFENV